MAIFHLNVSALSRGRGQSAVAAAAYRRCARMEDRRTGTIADFTRKTGHIDGGLFGWKGDAEAVWNAVEAREKHPRAMVAREIKLALPHELSRQGQFKLALGYCLWLREHHGVAGQFDLHAGANDPRNVHCHILMTTRIVDEDGAFGAKVRDLDRKPTASEHLRVWRAEWEQRVNAALAREGVAARVDRRSHEDRAEDGVPFVEPMEHLGPAAAAAERRGRRTAPGERNRSRAAGRAALARLRDERRELDEQIAFEVRRREPRPSPTMSDKDLEHYMDRMLAPTPLNDRAPITARFLRHAQSGQEDGWSDAMALRLRRSLRDRRRDSPSRVARLIRETVARGMVSATSDLMRLATALGEVLVEDRQHER